MSTHPQNQPSSGGMQQPKFEPIPPYRMSREELMKLHEETCNAARIMLRAKNEDYSGASPDCFSNFRSAENIGVNPVLGLLLRCGDKFQRIRSYAMQNRLSVENESIEDSIQDVINYMVLLKGMIIEARGGPLKGLSPGSPNLQASKKDHITPSMIQEAHNKARWLLDNISRDLVQKSTLLRDAIIRPDTLQKFELEIILDTFELLHG